MSRWKCILIYELTKELLKDPVFLVCGFVNLIGVFYG